MDDEVEVVDAVRFVRSVPEDNIDEFNECILLDEGIKKALAGGNICV
jgi:hypothetical protein